MVTGTDVEQRCQKISIESSIIINTGMGSLIRGQTEFAVRENYWFIHKVDITKYFVDNDKGDRMTIQA